MTPPKTHRSEARLVAVANQKGGVGKTTTAVNLGVCLAELRQRVLLVDLDPQANATTALGVDRRGLKLSTYDVLLADAPVDEALVRGVAGIDLLPSTLDLAGAEIELVAAFNREMRLGRALEVVRDEYDWILIDCPPSLGLLTVNALAAADRVMVPIQCEYFALEGLGQLMYNVDLVRRNLNPHLEIRWIVLCMYDARTKLAEEVAAEVKKHFGERVCRSIIPRSVRLSEAPSHGMPITKYDPLSRGAVAYRLLAQEVLNGT
ncbi:MAG: sporulation initiation inhibitor Soj [Acidimicrobiales bacterium]|nr:MAG: sporulation initiation inhibitor Soj [Acidimicrobiales bacterium]